MIRVEIGDPRHPQATALLQASHQLMQDLFPAESNHYLSVVDLCTPDITFFTATKDGTIIGTGALANKGDYGEIKSMFVAPDARGTGTAAAILRIIEDTARENGHVWLRLETGDKLHAAHRLYERHGFTKCGPFGDYPDDPLSLFMEKTLD